MSRRNMRQWALRYLLCMVANIYMEFFEELALGTAPIRPNLQKKYVDDIICTFRKGSTEELLHYLNGVRPTFKFTVETGRRWSTPFP